MRGFWNRDTNALNHVKICHAVSWSIKDEGCQEPEMPVIDTFFNTLQQPLRSLSYNADLHAMFGS